MCTRDSSGRPFEGEKLASLNRVEVRTTQLGGFRKYWIFTCR